MQQSSLSRVIQYCMRLGYYIKYQNGRISVCSKENQEHFTLTPLQLKYLIQDLELLEANFPDYTIYYPSLELTNDVFVQTAGKA